MQRIHAAFYAALVIVLAAFWGTTLSQTRQPQIVVTVNGKEIKVQNHGFSLTDESGTRKVIPLKIEAPGLFTVKLEWEGSAKNLSLILNGPGQSAFYARKDGPSPLYLQFQFSRQQLILGDSWQLSIVNFERGNTALGTALLCFPMPNAVVSPPKDTSIINYATFLGLDRSKWGMSKMRILPDGSIRIDYTNGSYVLRNKDSFRVYDAEVKQLYQVSKTVFFSTSVPAATPPDAVTSFANAASGNAWLKKLKAWIEGINNRLLDDIKLLLDNDSAMIADYLKLEKGKSIFQLLEFRLNMCNQFWEIYIENIQN